MQGLYCLGDTDRSGVKLCTDASDCGGGSCTLFDLGGSGITLGYCP